MLPARSWLLVSLSRHATPHHSLPTENLYHIQHDLADPTPKALKTKLREFFSEHSEVTVDVLVNNAAISNFHPLETFETLNGLEGAALEAGRRYKIVVE